MQLRPYQERVLSDLYQWFYSNHAGNPIVSVSVGGGKSVLIAALCKKAIESWPDTRILMCVHSRELCEQNLHKLITLWPQAPAGVHSASLGRKDMGHDVLFATIGSIYKKAHQLGRVDLFLVDECHLISPNEQTMYQRLIGELMQYNPDMRVIGWTGTAFRGDGVWLTENALFSHIASRVTMTELLKDGYLAPLVTAQTRQLIDTTGVQTRAGEFVTSALAKASDKAHLVRSACEQLVKLAADRNHWLVFAVTIAHAEHIAEELSASHGIACAVVTSETPSHIRAQRIKDFKAGKLRALVNVAVLTTGFDAPEVDCIALLRATKSPVLYVQIAGRGMRTAPGKNDCLWLDFTSTTAELGPVDQVKGRARSATGTGVAPFKYCDECGNPNAVMATVCTSCGASLPLPEEKPKHTDRASNAQVISSDGRIWRDVTQVKYREHKKLGKPDSLRVEYWDGFQMVASEWICVAHDGYAREQAMRWWHRRSSTPTPDTVEEAITRSGELRQPSRILVRKNERYWEVISHDFAGTESHSGSTEKTVEAVRDDLSKLPDVPASRAKELLRALRAGSAGSLHDQPGAVQ